MNNEPYAGWSVSPRYAIARGNKGSPKLLYIPLEAGEQALPVFSLEELAHKFLRYRAPGSEWHVKKFHDEEMITLLLGPYTGIDKVLPNPLPDPLAAQDALLNSIDREIFMEQLLE